MRISLMIASFLLALVVVANVAIAVFSSPLPQPLQVYKCRANQVLLIRFSNTLVQIGQARRSHSLTWTSAVRAANKNFEWLVSGQTAQLRRISNHSVVVSQCSLRKSDEQF
jgi:hypothetical protein